MTVNTRAGVLLVSAALSLPCQAVDYCDDGLTTVAPGRLVEGATTAPSDALVLFDGKDLSQWLGENGPAIWDVNDGVVTVRKGSGDIKTRESFHDLQLHLEWRVPVGIAGDGQYRGNSGVFLMDRYEVQILDSYHNRTYADGAAGAIYGQIPPMVNAMRPPGEWNTYDIIFTAPRFYDDGTLLTPARMTVLHNGVLIQSYAEVQGGTGAWGRPGYHDAETTGPIRLQDHPDPSVPISFRNIWVRPLGRPLPLGIAGRSGKGQPDLPILSSKTIGELLEDPVARAVLIRCVPELVPNPRVLEYIGKKTLPDLLGELDISLSQSKLGRIEAQLRESQSPAKGGSTP